MSIDIVRAELTIAKQGWERFRRDPKKYGSGVAKLYLFSLLEPTNKKHCQLASHSRAAYELVRRVDDILDGDEDAPKGKDPKEFALDIQRQIQTGDFDYLTPLSHLAKYAVNSLESRQEEGRNVRQEFVAAINPLVFDYDRRGERRVLTTSELEQYYWDSFRPITEIMLIALGSKWKAEDIREFGLMQPRVYSVRDYFDDYNSGIVNIPKEVMDFASYDASHSASTVWHNEYVQQWIGSQLDQAKKEADSLEVKLTTCEERYTVMFCKGPVGTVRKIIRDYST